MANSVTFPVELGGNGQTITDDADPTTGLANGGHRLRFVPALSQAVVMAETTVTKAEEANGSAEEAGAQATGAASSATAAAGSASAAASSASAANSSASTATTKAGEAAQSASDALEYRDQAEIIRDQTQAIAAGDVDITALQPGTLTNPKDYPSTDGAGNLVVRNVDTDVAAHLASGVETITFDAVDKGTVSTGTVSFDVQSATKQKLTVGGALTIALTNKPTNDWELEVDLTNGGSAAITFPTVNWLVGDGTTSTVFADMGVTLNAAGVNTLLFWGTGTGDVYGRAG